MSDLATHRPLTPVLPGGVGLFDSGVGGLTVLAPIVGHRPRWPTVMVADQAHVPYGGRPLEEIRGFALAQTTFLFERGVDQVVMACNISSATALDEARRRHGADRVWGMVEFGCELALTASRTGRIAVIATQGTIRSGAYDRTLTAAGAACLSVACPAFVPLVEAGELSGPRAERAIEPVVQRLLAWEADVVILGCTHYPFLRATLERLAPSVGFVDPADGVLARLDGRVRAAEELLTPQIFTTGSPARLARQLETFAPDLSPRLGRLEWRSVHDPAGSQATLQLDSRCA